MEEDWWNVERYIINVEHSLYSKLPATTAQIPFVLCYLSKADVACFESILASFDCCHQTGLVRHNVTSVSALPN